MREKYESLSAAVLRELAKARRIKGISTLKKAELVEAMLAEDEIEAKVQEAFSRLSKGKTVIMIAHRQSSIVDAARFCVLKDGSIAEEGTHKSLLAQGGIYAGLYNMQF